MTHSITKMMRPVRRRLQKIAPTGSEQKAVSGWRFKCNDWSGYLGGMGTKNSFLFLSMMAEIRKRYRQAKTIRLIVDNDVMHKSGITKNFLQHNKKFQLLVQPVYHPWVNKIEGVWKQLHDTVTRNHRHATMKQVMDDVRDFMNNVSPFPGSMIQQKKI